MTFINHPFKIRAIQTQFIILTIFEINPSGVSTNDFRETKLKSAKLLQKDENSRQAHKQVETTFTLLVVLPLQLIHVSEFL